MRTLVVDDSRTARRVLVRILVSLGGEQPVEANNGVEALEILARDAEFDLVLADMHMPRMDGLALIQNIRKDPRTRKLPILVVSSESDPDYILEAVKAGASGYVTKPFRPAAIKVRITEAIIGPQGVDYAAEAAEAETGSEGETPGKDSALEGDLENLSILDLLQFLSVQRRTGTLVIQTPRIDAAIVLRAGQVRAGRAGRRGSEAPQLTGEDALERVASEPAGRFWFKEGEENDARAGAIERPTLPLIFELARRRDEAGLVRSKDDEA